jgi:crotonobetainyl-CoA:carnitine CoA-transferase CaiB-like acyl-CoA transferase
MCQALGLDGLASDPRFARNEARLRHVEELGSLIGSAIATLTVAQCQALLDEAGVPAGPINNLQQVFADPQVIERGMVRELGEAGGKPARMIASPIRMSRTPLTYQRPPPKLGEHGNEILRDVLGA